MYSIAVEVGTRLPVGFVAARSAYGYEPGSPPTMSLIFGANCTECQVASAPFRYLCVVPLLQA